MARVKRSVNAKKKRREVLEAAKGYRGIKKNTYRQAKEQVMRSMSYQYRDRRTRKRDFRRLWIIRINAAARMNGLSYNQLMHGLKLAEIELDRKVLADLAVTDPKAFGVIAEAAKSALAATRRPDPGRGGGRTDHLAGQPARQGRAAAASEETPDDAGLFLAEGEDIVAEALSGAILPAETFLVGRPAARPRTWSRG